jgi:dolichol-phosphate mannosyltransferase
VWQILVDVSLIVPAHNEEKSLSTLIHEALRCYDRLGIHGEIVIVDDGSTDQTSTIARQLSQEEAMVKSLRLDEKSGKTNALRAGFHLTSGRVIVIVDADLQYDLAELPLLCAPILSSQYDLVNGYRVKRQDSLIRRMPSIVYNELNRHVFHIRIKDANSGFKAMRREVFASTEPLLRKDFHRYLVSMAAYMGYRTLEVPISHHRRESGKSKYSTPTRLITGLFDMARVRWLLRGFRNSVTTS